MIRSIGIITSPTTSHVTSSSYFIKLLEGIETSARIYSYGVTLLCNIFVRGKIVCKELKKIVSGVIVIAFPDEENLEMLMEEKIPTVLIADVHPRLSYVKVANKIGVDKAIEYLIQFGHKRIGLINGWMVSMDAKERYEAFLSALKHYRLEVDDSLIEYGNYDSKLGYYAMQRLLNKDITAVFCANDLMAISAMEAIKEKGLSVPEDISVIGFDNLDISQYTSPPLTTVNQPLFEMGKKAAEILISNLNDPFYGIKRIDLMPELVIRSSCTVAKN